MSTETARPALAIAPPAAAPAPSAPGPVRNFRDHLAQQTHAALLATGYSAMRSSPKPLLVLGDDGQAKRGPDGAPVLDTSHAAVAAFCYARADALLRRRDAIKPKK